MVSVRVRIRDLREQLGGECVLAYRYEPLACDVVKVMVRLSVRLRGRLRLRGLTPG